MNQAIKHEKITWWNILTLVKMFADNNELDYIRNVKKEMYAINRFNEEGWTPEMVYELMEKLACIKKSKLGKNPFWLGSVFNLSDGYGYKEKIQNSYKTLKDHEKIQTKPDSQPAIRQTTETGLPDTPKTYQEFLDWADKQHNFDKSTVLLYKSNLPIFEDETVLRFSADIPKTKRLILERYTGKTVEIE
jgi:hypothetical protein